MNTLATIIYRIMERVDGEHGIRIIKYKTAERVKIWCLGFIK